MHKALVLAGGLPQIALINELHRRGYCVLLADWNENPIAKQYCDKYYQVSTLDIDGITSICVNENVDFLLTICTDQALLTVAKVSETLKLPCYIDYQTALNVTNKQYMKDVFVKHKIPSAKHIVVNMFSANIDKGLTYPLIVKPVDCNSSKGVMKISDSSRLKDGIDNATKLSRTSTAIVEEYKCGNEVSIEVFVADGIAHILTISELSKIPDNDKFVIFRSISPAKIPDSVCAKIEKTAQKIADAFNIKNSPMLIQMIVDEQNVYVLEFSARTGGGEKFLTVKGKSGFDVVKAVVDLTEGKEVECSTINNQNIFVSEFIYCNPGIFDHFEGVDDLIASTIVDNFMPFKWKGVRLGSITNSGDRIGGFIISGKDYYELNQKHQKVLETLKVVDINGVDLMRRDLLPALV